LSQEKPRMAMATFAKKLKALIVEAAFIATVR
jgi:hypothetical protein